MRLPDRIIARIAAFSLIGVVNSVIGIGIILIAGLLGADPILANVVGYGVGLAVSFVLNSRVTFQSRRRDYATIARFLVTFAIAFAIDLIVVRIATGLAPGRKLLTSLAGTPVYMAVFYLLCEYWVFRRDANRPEHGRLG